MRRTTRSENAVLVLETLSEIRDDLDYGALMNRRLHAWACHRFQERIEEMTREAGVPFESVRPGYTSQTYHECGHV